MPRSAALAEAKGSRLPQLNKILTEAKRAAKLGLCLDPPDIVFLTQTDRQRARIRIADPEDEDGDGGDRGGDGGSPRTDAV